MPIFKTGPIMLLWGRRSPLVRARPVLLRRITARAAITLIVWAKVVPRAAPAGPIPRAPINRQSRAIFTPQARAIKYMGLLESPSPRKTELIML